MSPKTIILALTLITLTTGVISHQTIFTEASTNNWDQKGVNVQSTYSEDYNSDNFRESMRRASSIGVKDIVFVVPYIQSNFYANDLRPSGQTPSDSALVAGINFVKSLGMKPSIKVFAESPEGWRAYINPSDREGWFYNYSNILKKYATIAQQNDVSLFCIGTEMIKLTSAAENPDNTRRWKSLIQDVRSIYSGRVTYSAQYDRSWWDEIDNIEFFGDLDMIGVSAYYQLTNNNNPSVQELKDSWSQIEPRDIAIFANKYKKPIIFTEFGYKSMDRAFEVPGDWSINSNFNEANQAKGYEAFFQYFSNIPYFGGVHFWDWSTNPNAGGQGNIDFTPQNKSAQEVIRNYFNGGSQITTPVTNNNNGVVPVASTGNSNSSASQITPSQYFDLSANQNGSNLLVNIANVSGQNLTDLNLDIEIFQGSTRVGQQIYTGAYYNAGDAETITIDSSKLPQNPGTYTVKVGVFNANWSQTYTWKEDAGQYVVGNTNSSTPVTVVPVADTAATGIQIWWPGDGATVNGVQPFKARAGDQSLDAYSMFWQVDGGNLNEMYNSNQDGAHKESWVDLSSWNWQSNNQYTITFVAKDNNGNIIGQSSATITRS